MNFSERNKAIFPGKITREGKITKKVSDGRTG